MNKSLILPKEQFFCGGILNVVVPSLRAFVKIIQDNANLKGWLFRGQYSADWELESSLQRGLPKNETSFGSSHLEKFKTYSRGIIKHDQFSYNNDDEIWAIGQHNGLKTPLLDWTASPLVALFFAFEEEGLIIKRKSKVLDKKLAEYLKKKSLSQKDFRSVYFLDANKCNNIFYKLIGKDFLSRNGNNYSDVNFVDAHEELGGDPEEFIGRNIELMLKSGKNIDQKDHMNLRQSFVTGESLFLRILSPLSGENKRLLSQRGIFTKTYYPGSIDSLVKKKYKDDNLLIKVFLPNKIRAEAIPFLDSANINHMSLFPDLYGAAKYTNAKIMKNDSASKKDSFYESLRSLF